MQQEQTGTARKETLEKIIKKDSKTGRTLGGFWYYCSSALCVFMVLFYLYNAGYIPVDAQYHRGVYVLLTYVLIFLMYPFRRSLLARRPTVSDVFLALTAVAAIGYWIVEFENLNYKGKIVIDGRNVLKAKEAKIYEGVCW